MGQDTLDQIKRYLSRRQAAGLDVAYRIAEEASAASAPALEASSEPAPGAPRVEVLRPEREIAVVTSPVIERKPGIRYTTEHHATEQSSLFGEAAKTPGLDLAGYDLPKLDKLVSTCVRCRLSEGRTKTVFGSGSPAAKIMFIGEAPGRDEDLQGLPFVGRAGQLLTKMLAAIGFTRDEVYITNILKCRPPGNREPQEDEMTACEPYLARQLELIQPTIICALGRIAAHGLLKKPIALSILRQGVHYYNDIPVVVVYHPAALLRNPNLKRDAWEDLKMLRKLYDEATGEGA
jgi:uracil-DNA glycosylase